MKPISFMPLLLDSLLDFNDDSNTSSSWDDNMDDTENDSVYSSPPSRLPSHSKSNLNIGRSRSHLSHSTVICSVVVTKIEPEIVLNYYITHTIINDCQLYT